MERSGENMQLSTLRRYVTAMGGQVEIVARFPDREPVVMKIVRAYAVANRD